MIFIRLLLLYTSFFLPNQMFIRCGDGFICYWECKARNENSMYIIASDCMERDSKPVGNLFIQTSNTTHNQNHTECELTNKHDEWRFTCLYHLNKYNFDFKYTYIFNGTQSLFKTHGRMYSSSLSDCMDHSVEDLRTESKTQYEVVIRWQTHEWDKQKFIGNIFVILNNEKIQTLPSTATGFRIKLLSPCTEYHACLRSMGIGIDSDKILNEKCVKIQTKCKSESGLSLVGIIVIVMIGVILILVLALFGYYFACAKRRRRLNSGSEEKETDRVFDELDLTEQQLPGFKDTSGYDSIELLAKEKQEEKESEENL